MHLGQHTLVGLEMDKQTKGSQLRGCRLTQTEMTKTGLVLVNGATKTQGNKTHQPKIQTFVKKVSPWYMASSQLYTNYREILDNRIGLLIRKAINRGCQKENTMRLFEILDRVILNRTYAYNNDPVDYIVILDGSNTPFLYSTEHSGVSTVAMFSKEFLETEVRYITVDNGRLNIHIDNFTQQKHWKLEESLKKLYDLHGVSWINKKDKEDKLRKEQQDEQEDYCDDDDD